MNKGSCSDRQLLLVCAAVLAAILFAPPALAEGLGRLFFSPEQRAQLEQDRARNIAAGANSSALKEQENTEVAGEEDSTSSVLTVNGIVQKRGGTRTVWINGVAQRADSSAERTPESVTVVIPGKTQPVRVKVGQQLLLESPPPIPTSRKPAGQKSQPSGNEED